MKKTPLFLLLVFFLVAPALVSAGIEEADPYALFWLTMDKRNISGITVIDSAEHVNFTNKQAVNVSAKVRQGYKFATEHLRGNASTKLNGNRSTLTIMFWANFTTAPASNLMTILKANKSDSASVSTVLTGDISGSCTGEDISLNGFGGGDSCFDAGTLSLNTFYHFAFVWNSTNSSFMGFVNGVRGTMTHLGTGARPVQLGITLLGNDSSIARSFAGELDEIAVYNISLTGDQVMQAYQNMSQFNISYPFGGGSSPASVRTLTIRAINNITGNTITSFCARLNSSLTLCNTTSGQVQFTSNYSKIYNIIIHNVSGGTFFNYTISNVNFSIGSDKTVNGHHWQGFIRLNVTRLFLNTSIATFNGTNGRVENQTTTSRLIIRAVSGANNIKVDVKGNYTQNKTCTLSSPLTTQNCQSPNTYDAVYSFSAKNIFTGANINNFTMSLSNTSISASRVNHTTNANASFRLLQGYLYSFRITNSTLANENVTLESNASAQHYVFTLYTTNSINITFRNERTNALLINKTVTIDFISDAASLQRTTSNGSLYVDLLSPEAYTLQFSATGYLTRFYEFTLTDGTFNELTLYLLDSTNGTSVTVSIRDTLDNPVEGAVLKVQKYNITTNTFDLIEVSTTNFEGQTLANLVLNDDFYKFIVEVDGGVVLTTESTQIYANTMTLIVDLAASSGFEEVFTSYSLSGAITYLSSNNKFRYIYNDESNTASQGCLTLYSITEERTQVNQTCASSPSSTVFVTVSNTTGTAYLAVGTITDSAGFTHNIASLIKSFGDPIPEDGSGLIMMFFILLVFVMALGINVEVAIITAGFVPLMFTVMGLTKLEYQVTVPIFVLGLIVAFVMGVVKR